MEYLGQLEYNHAYDVYREEKSVYNSLDLLHWFISGTSKNEKNKENVVKQDTQKSKLSDQTVIIEDEKKFQEYFLKEKNKVAAIVYLSPVDQDFELALNKIRIESEQENKIEKEELVPAAQFPPETYLKNERIRRSKFGQANKKFKPLKKNFSIMNMGRWFCVQPVGLKGGADNSPENR